MLAEESNRILESTASIEYQKPFIVALILAVVDVGLSLWLKETRLRVGGIALANSISFTVGVSLLLVLVRRKLEKLEEKRILLTFVKVTVSTIPAAGVLILFHYVLGPWWEDGRTLYGFLLVFIAAVLFSGVVIGGYVVTKVEMLKDLTGRFRRKRK